MCWFWTRVPALFIVSFAPGTRVQNQHMIEFQAFGAVRWVECVQALKGRGITHIIECGPGKVLAGLTKRIDPELVGAALFDPATLAETRELLA